jgi:hypothetical protein
MRELCGVSRACDFHAPHFPHSKQGKDGMPSCCTGCHVGSTPGRSYCAVGLKHVAGRRFADRHLDLCLAAGLQMGGTSSQRSRTLVESYFNETKHH